MKYSPPTLQLCHILTENLNLMPVYHIRKKLFHQQVNKYTLIYICILRLVTWLKSFMGNMLLLKFEPGPLCWEFGALLPHY